MHSHCFWYDSQIRTTSGSGIICNLHFDEFFIGFASHLTDLEKFYCDIFKEEMDLRLPSVDPVMFFYNFRFVKRCGTRFEEWRKRIRDRGPDPRVRPRTGTVKRHGTAQHRTTDPASHPGPHSAPYGTLPLLSFSLTHW
jgi:hypothetical protein